MVCFSVVLCQRFQTVDLTAPSKHKQLFADLKDFFAATELSLLAFFSRYVPQYITVDSFIRFAILAMRFENFHALFSNFFA